MVRNRVGAWRPERGLAVTQVSKPGGSDQVVTEGTVVCHPPPLQEPGAVPWWPRALAVDSSLPALVDSGVKTLLPVLKASGVCSLLLCFLCFFAGAIVETSPATALLATPHLSLQL